MPTDKNDQRMLELAQIEQRFSLDQDGLVVVLIDRQHFVRGLHGLVPVAAKHIAVGQAISGNLEKHGFIFKRKKVVFGSITTGESGLRS